MEYSQEESTSEEKFRQRDQSNKNVNNELVQIKAESEEEILRRINAFIRNKRNEVNERNIREFISPFSSDPGNSCARVDAVYVHTREGSKSHITLKSVENLCGPQTMTYPDDNLRGLRVPPDVERSEAIEERMANMEDHLNITRGSQDVYRRLKDLEERIMFLEGISPEYFTQGPPLCRQSRTASSSTNYAQANEMLLRSSQSMSLTDINRRIKDLKEALKKKT